MNAGPLAPNASPRDKSGGKNTPAIPTTRTRITETLVRQALRSTREGGTPHIYTCTDIQGLRLCVGKARVVWRYKTRLDQRTLGRADEITLAEAREAALKHRGNETIPDRVRAAKAGWTLRSLFERYAALLAQDRTEGTDERFGKASSEKDAKSVLLKPCLDPWLDRRLPDVNAATVVAMRDAVATASTAGQARKFLAYAKAALGHALNYHMAESCIGELPYWIPIRPPVTLGHGSKAKRAKSVLDADEVGFLAARHEAYCDSKSNLAGQFHVGPGVRYGLLFLLMCAQRRYAIVNLRRDGLFDERASLPDGWGVAVWPASLMKGSVEHALPLPPVVMSICRKAMEKADAIRRKQSDAVSAWVFPSSVTRRRRSLEAGDMHVGDSALSLHLATMRGQRGHQPEDAVDWLEGLPQFSLHQLRHSLASHVGNVRELPGDGASAVLAHRLPGDTARMPAATTGKFYDHAQKLDLKAQIVGAWTQAVLAAYVEAGGSEFAAYLSASDTSGD